MSLDIKTCGECHYFQLIQGPDENVGECYRKPPTLFITQQMAKKSTLDPTPVLVSSRATYYPVVTVNNRSCGEFEPFLNNDEKPMPMLSLTP